VAWFGCGPVTRVLLVVTSGRPMVGPIDLGSEDVADGQAESENGACQRGT